MGCVSGALISNMQPGHPIRKLILSLALAFVLSSSVIFADPVSNVEIMRDAARKLEWSDPENRAYYLIKNETIVSVVAIIFGYWDNAAACKDLADALSNPVRVGTFDCSPVF